MPFYKWGNLQADFMTPAYSPGKGPTVQGEKILMARLSFPAGGRGQRHAHPNEQIIWVTKGKQRLTIGKESKVMEPGDVAVIPANTEHEAEILEDMEMVTCKDLVADWSIKEAKWEKKS